MILPVSSSSQRFAVPDFVYSKWGKTALLVSGLVITIFLLKKHFSNPKNSSSKTTDEPESRRLSTGLETRQSTQTHQPSTIAKSNTVSDKSFKKPEIVTTRVSPEAIPDKKSACWFRYISNRQQSYWLEFDLKTTVDDILRQLGQKLGEDICYLDIALVHCGRVISNSLYCSMHELQQRYIIPNEFKTINGIIFLIRKPHQEHAAKFIDCLDREGKLEKVFYSGETGESESQRFSTFRISVISYCSRVYRGKCDAIQSIEDLQELRIFLENFYNSQRYRNKDAYWVIFALEQLLSIVTESLVVYIKRWDQLLEQLTQEIDRLAVPPKIQRENINPFTVVINTKAYHFSSLDELAKHSAYFEAWAHLEEKNGKKSCILKEQIEQDSPLHTALFYLQGEEMSIEDNKWFDLLQASDFLQIPRLKLICQEKLIQLLKDNRLEIDFSKEELGRLQYLAPYFYRALHLIKH